MKPCIQTSQGMSPCHEHEVSVHTISPFACLRREELLGFLQEMQDEGFSIDILLNSFTKIPRSSQMGDAIIEEDILDVFFNLAHVTSSKVEYYPVFLHTPFQSMASSGPILWRLKDVEGAFFQHLFALNAIAPHSTFPWGHISLSKVSFKTMVFHWQSLLEVQLHNYKRAHLRCYDPRILWGMISGSNLKEQVRLFGPATFLVSPPGNFPSSYLGNASCNDNDVNVLQSHWSLAQHPDGSHEAVEHNEKNYYAAYQKSETCWFYELLEEERPQILDYTSQHQEAFKHVQDSIDQANLIVFLWESNPVSSYKFSAHCEEKLNSSMEQVIAELWSIARKLRISQPDDIIRFAWLFARHYQHAVFSQKEYMFFFEDKCSIGHALDQIQQHCESFEERNTDE